MCRIINRVGESVEGRMRLCWPWHSGGSQGRKANHGTHFRDFCVSNSNAEAARRFSCGNDVTVPRDVIISEAGFGPAWSMPSCRIETSEKGEGGRALE
jgi:hypothetical protein